VVPEIDGEALLVGGVAAARPVAASAAADPLTPTTIATTVPRIARDDGHERPSAWR
jgi:hypothetical protein